MDMNSIYTQMIAAAGNAKALVYEALDVAIAGDDAGAEAKLREADGFLAEAHAAQSKVLQVWAASIVEAAPPDRPAVQDARSELTGPLLMHAQDLIMTTMSERALAERMIKLARRPA